MICGRIKCFFESRGYGYIEDFDGKEVYFNLTALEGGVNSQFQLVNGATVYFEVMNTSMGAEAYRVRLAA